MNDFLQWTSILAAAAVLVGYSFFRDHLDLKKAQKEARTTAKRPTHTLVHTSASGPQ